MSKKVRLPPFLSELTEDRLKTLIEVQTTHLLERLSD
jgi:coenzyme F420-reducing hydrogenase alpha subunit